MTLFTKAIVRPPSASMVDGLTTAHLGKPDFQLACQQHQAYVQALKQCGLSVIELEPLTQLPDSCFVEDVALLTPECAILTLPGAESRRAEVTFIEPVLREEFSLIEEIEAPGTLEAGDVMMVGNDYYIGLSERTNRVGAEQLIKILEKYQLRGIMVDMTDVLHLKTALSYIEHNNLVACGALVDQEIFDEFQRIDINLEEAYAANCVWVNDHVLVASGFPNAASAIRQAGYAIIELDMSEFQKLDGGLSCLSLRY